MQKYQETVISALGRPVVGAAVRVTTLAGAAATIYSDNGVTPIISLVTDSTGAFGFYAADGRYTVTISGAGFPTRVISDILLEDPSDADVMNVGRYGAANDAGINAAVANLPSDGGTIYLPRGTYQIAAPISDAGKRVRFALDAGAVIKPTVDTDVFRLTGYNSGIVGQGRIDGSLVVSGSGNGVVVGYGGANAAQVDVACSITAMRGWGIKYENGAFLKTDVVISNCVAGGIQCTANYDDNNHGDFLAHIVNCTGPGFQTVYTATVALRSRSHHFRQVKAFGCAPNFDINTEQSAGFLFSELNGGTGEIMLGAHAWGNILFITGANGEPDVTESVAGSNMILGPQGGGYEYAAARRMVTQMMKLRDRTNSGGVSMAMTGANEATLTNTDQNNVDFTLKLHNKDFGSGWNVNTQVDKLSFARGSGTIDRLATASVSCAFGTVVAHGTTGVSAGFTTGAGASCVLTWASTTANIPAGIVLVPSVDFSTGALVIRAVNTTAADIVVGTHNVRYMVMTHF